MGENQKTTKSRGLNATMRVWGLQNLELHEVAIPRFVQIQASRRAHLWFGNGVPQRTQGCCMVAWTLFVGCVEKKS
jgi:hypothetical protein